MNHRQVGLFLRLILALMGFLLALESYYIGPIFSPSLPQINFPSSSNPSYDPSPSWSDNDYNDGGGGGWDFGGGGDSGSWDSGGGWDSGGDSGSWDSGGGDSGSW